MNAQATGSRAEPPRRNPVPTDVSPDEASLRPPLVLLAVAAGSVSVSALLLLGSGRGVDLIGYMLATLVTVLAVSGYRALDSRRRSRPTYVIPRIAQLVSPQIAAWTLLLLGVAVGAMHVWRFAEAVARQ